MPADMVFCWTFLTKAEHIAFVFPFGTWAENLRPALGFREFRAWGAQG